MPLCFAPLLCPGGVAGNVAGRSDVRGGFVYRNAIKGFSAVIPNARVAEVRAEGLVERDERDERDGTVTTAAPPGVPLTWVKVLGCNGSGSASGVIAGVSDHLPLEAPRSGEAGSVGRCGRSVGRPPTPGV